MAGPKYTFDNVESVTITSTIGKTNKVDGDIAVTRTRTLTGSDAQTVADDVAKGASGHAKSRKDLHISKSDRAAAKTGTCEMSIEIKMPAESTKIVSKGPTCFATTRRMDGPTQ